MDRYIELLKRSLIDFNRVPFPEYRPLPRRSRRLSALLLRLIDRAFNALGFVLCRKIQYRPEERLEGRDWPVSADSMIGMKRLDNLEYCVRTALKDGVEGDLIETGVWRGGATILMRALLETLGDPGRKVWVADSFAGLPPPDGKYAEDGGDTHHLQEELAIPLETVRANFEKYGLLDDRVVFLKGWFKDTLPTASIEKIAVLRLDGDMYASTMDGLVHLYPKVSPGGFVIVDDWGAVPACRKAVEDYRRDHAIDDEIHEIDWTGVYWRKGGA